MVFTLIPGELTYKNIIDLASENTEIELAKEVREEINLSAEFINEVIQTNKTIYGINTGFGLLANASISREDLNSLQTKLILSHATGVGEDLAPEIVRLILLLKINSLARGFSGVRLKTIEYLITLFNKKIYPCIPAKGSVGASGDLAPLAHLSAALLGVGDVFFDGKKISAVDALNKLKLEPLTLAPKEGLALINGTQVSTALALFSLIRTFNLFHNAIAVGALSSDALLASDSPFDERIQKIRGFKTQSLVAKNLRDLLAGSEIRKSHLECDRVQDPYSLRCQPQVMGACLNQMLYAQEILMTEVNAVSDNPLVFANDKEILSGGNFHAEPVALAADSLALAIAEIGALSERRIALLIDPNMSQLPAFLVENAGLNSGFMIAQVTAAALASENKSLAHPASVDSIPTSANQEDHVSMATYAARRLQSMVENSEAIIAIELLAACQGIDFRRPLKTSERLEKIYSLVRNKVPFYKEDRYFAPDIEECIKIVRQNKINEFIEFKT